MSDTAMDISVDTTGPLERRVTVQVPEEQIASAVRERLKSLSRTTRMDGFRPGKVPIRVVERRFGPAVRQEIVGEVLQRSFSEAITQKELRPAGEPTIDPVNADPGSGLSYTAVFEVYPEISLDKVDTLEISRPVCSIEEPDIERMIENLRQQRKSWEPVERGAADGDRLVIDFQGFVDGAEFEGGSQEEFAVEIGSGWLIEGFESGLIGTTADQKLTLDLKFPTDYQKAELADKPVKFEVAVESVSEAVIPELGDEFFTAFGVTDGGMEAFRVEVTNNMEREKKQRLTNQTKQRLMVALHEGIELDLPKAMVSHDAQHQCKDMQQRMLMQGAPKEEVDKLKPELFEEESKRRVTLGLIVGEIVKTANLTAEPSKVREIIEAAASSYEEPSAVVKWYYDDHSRLAEVESGVLEDEAVAWVLGRAQVKDEAVSFDALINPGQTEDSKTETA